nr:unknown [Glycine max]
MQNQQISSQMIFLQNQTKTFHHSFLVPSFWLNDYSDGFSVCLWTFMSSSFHFCSSMCIPIRLQCRIHFLPQFPKVHCIDIKLHI